MPDDFSFRHVDARLVLLDAEGRPCPGAVVRVEQVRHAFGFGATGSGMDLVESELQELYLDLFDTATLSFYWGRYEPEPGRTALEPTLATARWFAERGVRLKGHPLVWHTVKAPWVDRLPLAEAERLLRERIRREVRDFAGVVDTWDVINEVVIMPRFVNEPDGVPNAITRMAAEKGRVEMVRLAVEEARSQGTEPTLVLNDFDLGPEYERLVADVLDAGIRIDAIGLQSHMHQGFRGRDQLWEICERFAGFGLPLHWTETTLLSGDLMPAHIEDLNDYVVDSWPTTPEGEARQADEIVQHYSTLAAHPAVEAVTYWGFCDRDQWLGAPSGLVRADGTPKPSYWALRDLVRGDWWYEPHEVVADADGCVRVSGGWAGRYALTRVGDAPGVDTRGVGARVEVDLPAGPTRDLSVTL